MKFKNIYAIVILVVSALVLSWAVPEVVRLATTTSSGYPFSYFSSVKQRFVLKDMGTNGHRLYDTAGEEYTQVQYDSITPLFSYRQLMLDNRMPETIMGVEIEPRELRMKTIVWRYSPKKIDAPQLGMYLMYEAMHGRTSFESPKDVFRLDEKIEFVTKETNRVNEKKSALFQNKMLEEGFTFPAHGVWGNLSARKPYDEGYFVLDDARKLYHIKMVNNRPYVRDTHAGDSIDIKYFDLQEVPDKSIYGFIVSKSGEVYTLNEGYTTTKFDIPAINPDKDNLMLMTNAFYWMVNITTDESCTYHVLEAGSLKQHAEPYVVKGKEDRWNTVSEYLFPVYTTLTDSHSSFMKPELHFSFGISLILSLVLAVVFAFTVGKKRNGIKRVAGFIVTVIFGIPGFITSLLIK